MSAYREPPPGWKPEPLETGLLKRELPPSVFERIERALHDSRSLRRATAIAMGPGSMRAFLRELRALGAPFSAGLSPTFDGIPVVTCVSHGAPLDEHEVRVIR